MNPIIRFGAFLAVCRDLLGKTQAQIAEACAVTPEALCQIERGRRKPSFELVLTLADALHVDRTLLSRFALQSRALEFYTTLGLAPVEQAALDAAYPCTVLPGVLAVNQEAPVDPHSAPPAESPLTPALPMPSEPTPPAC